MRTEKLIKELEYTIEKTREQRHYTGETRIDLMAKDCLDKIVDLAAEADRLKAELEATATICVGLQTEVDRLKAERRWIPVSERLPEKDGVYLAWVNDDIEFAIFRFKRWWSTPFEESYGELVTHWMPLPQPPEGT